MLAKVDIAKYGSGKLRKKLNYIEKLDWPQNRYLEPIIKGRNYKPNL